MEKRKFKVSGMSCAACSARVERAVSSLSGVDSCEVNLILGEMSVLGDADTGAIVSAVENAGYGATLDNGASDTDELENGNKREIFSAIKRLSVSGGVLAVLMYISMGHLMWGFPLPSFIANSPILLGTTELVLCSLIMGINKQFFIKGVRGIVNLAPNMDTLVALGSSVSYVYSIVLFIKICTECAAGRSGEAHHILHGLYFESAAMILVLITVGKLLESLAKGRTTSAIRSLMDLSPKTATVIREGKEVTVPVSEIRRGDVFIVKKGDNVACDGVITEGEISIDGSALTGESLPKDALPGDGVFGATTVLSGWAKIEAVKVGEETAIFEIIKMVKEASSSKAPVAKAADKISGIFVPAVLLISLATFVIWMLVGAEISYAIARAVTVLVISCPCALGLATPVAIMVGSGVGAGHGILFKNATSLEASGKIKIVALDKTGTLTEGKPEISEVAAFGMSEAELLSFISVIEKKSEHPLASAVVSYADENGYHSDDECEDFEAFVGGVSGIVSGKRYFIGNERFITEKIGSTLPDDFYRMKRSGMTTLAVAGERDILGVLAISDMIKEDSREAVAELNTLGIKTVMITGDNRAAAEKVAASVGITEIVADVLPGDKARIIKELSKNGSVAMVGDGVNDSVALTEADVGIAIGKGADVAIDSADVVLKGGSLKGVPAAIRLGRRVLTNVYENLFWAFSYNVVGIPLAAGAFAGLLGWSLTPMFGAAAMSVSSFLVVVNALRLNLYDPTKTSKNVNQDCQNTNFEAKITKSEELAVKNINGIESLEVSVNLTSENKIEGAKKCEPTYEKENQTTAAVLDVKAENERNNEMNITIKINGMMCPHCSGRVKKLLEESPLVVAADVSHERGDAVVVLAKAEDEATVSTLKEIINGAGYETP